MGRSLLLSLFGLLTSIASAAAQEPDIVIADFEGDDYGDWSVEGAAFGPGPAKADGQLAAHQVTGFEGRGAGHSGAGGDDQTGKLTSPLFTIERPYLNLLLGGGGYYRQTCVNLLVDGQIVRTDTGVDRDTLRWLTWDVSEFAGQSAQIEIVDDSTAEWGHILVDSIALSETNRIRLYPNSEIDKAMAILRADAADCQLDPWRPAWHLASAAGTLNDANGLFYKDGWYHVFYQLWAYPGGPNVVVGWAHARSRDLVHWQAMPLAVWPRRDRGEGSCFSGGMQFAADGTPVLFYASVPLNPGEPFTQNAVVPVDEDYVTWEWLEENPVLPYRQMGEPEMYTVWRDPFPFRVGERTMMTVGGTGAGLPFYEATDGDLGSWEYKGIGYAHDAECPNFFQLDGKWILLSSAGEEGLLWYTGDFDPEAPQFTPTAEGVLEESRNLLSNYGTGVFFDDRGRCILMGRVRGGRGAWDGYLCLPRVLTLAEDGTPRQQPVPELESLRTNHVELANLELTDEVQVLENVAGDNLEIIAEFSPGNAEEFGLILRRAADGSRGISIHYAHGSLTVDQDSFACDLTDNRLRLHIFNDRIALEVFVGDGRQVLTATVYPPEGDLQVAAYASGGRAVLERLDAWQLAPAPLEPHASLTSP